MRDENEMTREELIIITIDKYMDLQRIKDANGDTVNEELEYQIRGIIAKLNAFGVSVEDITM